MGESWVKAVAWVRRIDPLPETANGLRPCIVTSTVRGGAGSEREVTDTVADCRCITPGLRVSVLVRD